MFYCNVSCEIIDITCVGDKILFLSFLIDWLLFSEKIEKKLSCILCEFPGEKANLYCQSLSFGGQTWENLFYLNVNKYYDILMESDGASSN